MINRMKEFEKGFSNRKLEQFINEKKREAPLLRGEREDPASRWGLFMRRMVILFKDLDRYIDFCLARYIVWRETRKDERDGNKIMTRKEGW